MKTILAYICYYIGDFMYKLSCWSSNDDVSYFFWSRYQQFMIWSDDFDVNEIVWPPATEEEIF